MKTRRKSKNTNTVSPVQTAPREVTGISRFYSAFPENADTRIYSAMRKAVPIIGAAIDKIVRLVGSFRVVCESDGQLEMRLDRFVKQVRCADGSEGMDKFISSYLDCLLVKGTAVGEIVLTSDADGIGGLYNADLGDICFKRGDSPFDIYVCRNTYGDPSPAPFQQLISFTALKPEEGRITGRSLLEGLPKMSETLMKIYDCVGNNFERMGNLRYAVTYRPADSSDRVGAKERASVIAREWSSAMQPGTVKDFVAVGDVDVKVIGADAQMISTEVPVRQILEQIVAKTGLPPFMLGLSWSSTERMSSQQADILTSELEYYRRLLDPVILKICNLWQRFEGRSEPLRVEWDNINLQDEVELARARLYNAQAKSLEASVKGENSEG